MKTNIDKKSRTWAFILYPESMPDNWQEILDSQYIPWARSPLHDSDVNPSTNEIKKPHYHYVMTFSNARNYSQVKEITDSLCAPSPQPCLSLRGAVRYFLHLDNPEKHQYSADGILFGSGFDLNDALKLTASQEDDILDQLEELIISRRVSEFNSLVYFVRTYKPDWRSSVRKNTLYLSQLIKSNRHSKAVLDIETGEAVS